MERTFDCLVRWLAPIICYTAEEAWLARHGDAPGRSLHLETFAMVPRGWLNPSLGERWAALRDIRRVATGALELERGAKRIGSSLQAAISLYVPAATAMLLDGVDLAELCITSAGELIIAPPPEGAFMLPELPNVGVVVRDAPGDKCERCWRVLPEVGSNADYGDLCHRCADVVGHLPAAAQ